MLSLFEQVLLLLVVLCTDRMDLVLFRVKLKLPLRLRLCYSCLMSRVFVRIHGTRYLSFVVNGRTCGFASSLREEK